MSAGARVRAVGVALAVVAMVALPAPSAAQAPSAVTLQATPPGFESQQVITLAAEVQSTWDIYSWCNYWNGYDGCWVLGPYMGHVEIAGSNGFFQPLTVPASTGHTLSTSDPGPGLTMQPVTYTATGWVAWRVCTQGEFYYSWVDCWAEALYWEPAGTAQKTVVPSIVPTVDSVSPNSGSGATQTFTLKYSSTAGAGDLWDGWVWFTPVMTSGVFSCVIRYTMVDHTLSLLNDAATAWLSRAVGTGPVLQNSQCLVNTLMAGASPSGNTWTVNVPVTFESAFAGPKNIFMYAGNQWGTGSGWHDKGDWTVQCLTNVTPANPTVPASSGQVTLAIVTGQDCAWTAPATSGFLTRTAGGSGVGSGQVSYAYTANGSANPRTAQPTIAGQVVTVTQVGTAQAPPGEQVSYYHLDAIGSVRVVTNMNGGVVRRHDFLPFGQEYDAPTPTDPVLFTGQERDPETALDYFEARYYTAQTERFTSPDPIAVTPGRLLRPDRLNRYVYANQNPLRFIDPSGLSACDHESSEDCWQPCIGWLIVTGCGWYEGLLGFDQDGYLLDDFRELGEANWLTRRATAPVTAEQLAAMRVGILSPASTQDATVIIERCVAANISEVNRVSGLNVDRSHVLRTFVQGGAINVDFSVPTASPADLRPTRYLAPTVLGVLTGIGPTLHVPPPPQVIGRGNQSIYGVDSANGNFTFTAHIDTAYAFHPTGIGVLVHWLVDVRAGGAHRGPC